MAIPKIIHFIWLGEPILNDRLAKIRQWSVLNPNIKVILWLDKQGANNNAIYGKKYLQVFEKPEKLVTQNSEISIKDIQTLSETVKGNNYWECIRYEIDKLRPNYGAASDLIRLAVLEELGGAYYDSDVTPIKIEHLELWEEDDLVCMHKKCFNDIIICNQGNNFIKRLRQVVLSNYISSTDSNSFEQIYSTYLSDSPLYIVTRTINKTGPNTIIATPGNEVVREIKELRTRESAESDQSWCGRKVKTLDKAEDLKQHIENILRIIDFELRATRTLHFKDHVENLKSSLSYCEVDIKGAIARLITEANKLPSLFKLKNFQYNFNCPYQLQLNLSDAFLRQRSFLLPWDNRVITSQIERAHKQLILSQASDIFTPFSSLHEFISSLKSCCTNSWGSSQDAQSSSQDMLRMRASEIEGSCVSQQTIAPLTKYLEFSCLFAEKFPSDRFLATMLEKLNIIVQEKHSFLSTYVNIISADNNIPLDIRNSMSQIWREIINVYNSIGKDMGGLVDLTPFQRTQFSHAIIFPSYSTGDK